MNYSIGRSAYGLAAMGFGLCALMWHDVNSLPQLKTFALRESITDIVGVVQLLGGAAVQWPRTARVGAMLLGALYLVIALMTIPAIIRHPFIYNSYGNFFEQLSLVSGSLILYSRYTPLRVDQTAALAKAGYYSFGICVLSFGLEQLFYLPQTASLVPHWMPFGQLFWAILTTAAFVLAAIALTAGYKALLAAQLTTAMLAVFGLLVWLPALFADPGSFLNWSETMETLAIAATAWIVAESLRQRAARISR